MLPVWVNSTVTSVVFSRQRLYLCGITCTSFSEEMRDKTQNTYASIENSYKEYNEFLKLLQPAPSVPSLFFSRSVLRLITQRFFFSLYSPCQGCVTRTMPMTSCCTMALSLLTAACSSRTGQWQSQAGCVRAGGRKGAQNRYPATASTCCRRALQSATRSSPPACSTRRAWRAAATRRRPVR